MLNELFAFYDDVLRSTIRGHNSHLFGYRHQGSDERTICSAVEKSTLGNLVSRFIDEIGDSKESDLTIGSSGGTVQITIRTTFGAVAIQRLNDLVDGRNPLLHHVLSQVVEGWDKNLLLRRHGTDPECL